MAGLFDWLTDGAVSSPVFGGGTPMQPGPGATMPQSDPMGNPTGQSMPLPTPAPAATQPMPPVQQTGADAPYPQGTDSMTAGGPVSNGPGLPYPDGSDPMTAGGPTPNGPGLPPPPLPQPRPPGAAGQPLPPGAAPPPPTPPTALPPPGNGTNGVGPGLGVGAPSVAPGQSMIARALGITDKQAQQSGAALAEGLKSVGTNYNKPGMAAFAGTAGAALEGGQKKQEVQDKSAADYLKASIDAKAKGDEAGYKQNYLRYLAAKLQADTDKAATKDAGANKNDTPTQLYLSAQRLVQHDSEVVDAGKALAEARKNGTPDEVAKAQANLTAVTQAKQAQHLAALGLNPQTAAQVAKQPGNTQENPVDAGKAGITKDNIGQKLQPGQYFINPADGKTYQYKGTGTAAASTAAKKTPDKPTNPEPADPMNKSEVSTGSTGKTDTSSDDDDD